MSGPSSSTSTTEQNTTTEQFDQRQVASEFAVVVGPDSENISVEQIPPIVGEVVKDLIDASREAAAQAIEGRDQQIEELKSQDQDDRKLLVFALTAAGVIALVGGFRK